MPSKGSADRFVPPSERLHLLHLAERQGGLRLCEDTTTLLAGLTGRRLQRVGLVADLGGVTYCQAAAGG